MEQVASKYKSFEVAGSPVKAMAGYLDDDGKPKGEAKTVTMNPGELAVPNFSIAWGIQQLDKKGVINGEIKYLTWGDPSGSAIELRFHPSSKSVDKRFQEEIQKLKTLQDKWADIPLFVGLNDFDPVYNKVMIELLEHHYLNGANESRDPNMPVAFRTYNAEGKLKVDIMKMQNEVKARQILLDANSDIEAIQVLAGIFGKEPKRQNHILFGELEEIVREKPDWFIEILDRQRADFEFMFSKAKDVELLSVDDLHGDLYVMEKGTKSMLVDLNGVNTGNHDKERYILLNFYQPKYYAAVTRLERVYKQYEKEKLEV